MVSECASVELWKHLESNSLAVMNALKKLELQGDNNFAEYYVSLMLRNLQRA